MDSSPGFASNLHVALGFSFFCCRMTGLEEIRGFPGSPVEVITLETTREKETPPGPCFSALRAAPPIWYPFHTRSIPVMPAEPGFPER